MSPRFIAALFAVALLAPAAQAAPAASTDAVVGELPLDWFTRGAEPAGDLWRFGQPGGTTYSYLPGRQPASRLDLMLARAGSGPARRPWPAAAEQTYTVVERVGRDRLRRPLPTAAFLFASAVCGIGGLAWWRCSSREQP